MAMANRYYDFNNSRVPDRRAIKYVVDPRLLQQAEEKGDEHIVKLLLKEGGFEAAKGSGVSKMPEWLALAFKCGSSRCAIIRNLLKYETDANEKIAPSEIIFYSLLEGETATCRMMIEYVAKIKAKTGKKFNNERNLTLISKDPKMKIHYEMCRAELADMKNKRIGNTPITCLTVLTEPPEVVARYARHEDLVNEFDAGDCFGAYPIYTSLLKRKFKAAMAHMKTIEQGAAIR